MNASLLLAIATLALVVGPLLERIARKTPGLAALIDGATVGGIVVVALFHLMPEATAHVGLWAVLFLFIGLVLPLFTERLFVRAWSGWRVTVGFLVLLLFVGHLLVEGAALASTAANNERLALATVIVVAGHNLPLGLVLWGQTRRRFGFAWSVAVLVAVGAITWFGPLVIPIAEGKFSAVCSAVLAGGLLHLVLQHSSLGENVPAAIGGLRRNALSALGALVTGTVLFAYLGQVQPGEHAHGVADLPRRFVELCLVTAPPLLLGVIGASLMEAFLPHSAARWLGRGRRSVQAVRGVVLGAPMPVCSCGVLPIYRTLILKGVSPTAALALLIAAPEIGIDSLLLSLPLLGTATTVARFLSALALALAVGWIVGWFVPQHRSQVREGHAEPRPPVAAALRRGLLETWGHLAPWILVGLFAAAFVEPLITVDWARATPPWLQILVLSLVGMPTYICATAATPLAALLLASGFTPGAVIAFLLTGPATNLTTFGALARLHSRRVALAFVGTALLVTCAIGLVVNLLLPAPAIPEALGGEAHDHGVLSLACAVVLLLLTLWVLLRVGPRGFMAQLGPEEAAHDHDHSAPGPPHDPRDPRDPRDIGLVGETA